MRITRTFAASRRCSRRKYWGKNRGRISSCRRPARGKRPRSISRASLRSSGERWADHPFYNASGLERCGVIDLVDERERRYGNGRRALLREPGDGRPPIERNETDLLG